jgi:hypothetical protein
MEVSAPFNKTLNETLKLNPKDFHKLTQERFEWNLFNLKIIYGHLLEAMEKVKGCNLNISQ